MKSESLGNLIEQIRGITYKKEQSTTIAQKGYIPLLRAGNIGEAQELNFDDLIYVPSKLVRQEQYLKKGDILISTSSGSINIIGKSAKIESNLEISFGAFCKVIRCKGNVNPDYLALFFRTDFYRKTISNLARGVNINNLKSEHISKLKIPYPSIEQQKKIADTLNQLESIIKKRKQSLLFINELVKAIYLQKFEHYFFNNDLQIPLGNVILKGPQNGLYKHESFYGKGVKILRIDSFYDGLVNNIQELKRVEVESKEIDLYSLSENDIVINRVNSRKYLGKSAIIPKLDEPTVFESNMMRFSLNQKRINPQFLIFTLQQKYIYLQIQQKAKDAINQSSINQKDVKSIKIPNVPIDEQVSFASVYDKIVLEKTKMILALNDSEHLFKSLLQKAFRGELEFNEDEYEVQEGIINLNWYQSQLESISKNNAILESVSKVQKILENNSALQSIANMNKAIQQFQLPALKQIENLNKILNRFQVPYLDAISKIEQIEELKAHPALKNLNIEDYYNQSIEEQREEERLKEIEQELKEENDPVLKFISETQIGKATLGNYKVNFPRFIHESFNGEEFTISEIIERLGSEYALANVKEENVLADIFRLFRVFIKLQFKETAFTFQQLAEKLKERLFNPSFEILHKFVSEELKMNSDLVQVYFPGNMQVKYPVIYEKLLEEKALNKLYLVSINGNS